MAVHQVDADALAPCAPDDRLKRALDAVPPGAPVCALVHGYRFRVGDPARDPHVQLYGASASGGAPHGVDWPRALGFAAGGRADGLCIGFGWNARAPHLSSLARRGRNGFAVAYARAAEAGARLGDLAAAIAERRPDLRLDIFAHSLGARVALRAAAAPGIGRLILLGAAEDAAEAAARFAEAPPWVEAHHFAARHNDFFDLIFESAAPRREGRQAVALGRRGLPGGHRGWIDLELDRPALAAWLAARGAALAPASPRVCHWSFYMRPGAMDLYRAILRDRAAWSPAAMRAAGAPEGLSPPWSRLVVARAARRGWAGRIADAAEAASQPETAGAA